jgi:hypothetical protein
MKLFDFKKKNDVFWTEKDAPKNRVLTLNIDTQITVDNIESYISTTNRLAQFNVKAGLICKTDTERDAIKAEVAEQLNEVYDKICQAIDADSTYLTDGFWSDLAKEKAKENQL